MTDRVYEPATTGEPMNPRIAPGLHTQQGGLMDPMTSYTELQERLNKLDPRLRGWYHGFIDGLLYAQVQDPNIDDRPIRVTEPVLDAFDTHFDPQVFKDVLMDLDDEGGIVAHRMWVAPFEYTNPKGEKTVSDMSILYIELVTTEGHRGVPEDWDDLPNMTPEEILEARPLRA